MALLHVFEGAGEKELLFRQLLREELRTTSSASVLFRESTPAVSILAAYLKFDKSFFSSSCSNCSN